MALVLSLLSLSAVATADPLEALSVTAEDGRLSLEAANAPLDRVLIRIGEAIGARVVIETAAADDLARARIDTSFSGIPVIAALRRLIGGRQYVVTYGSAGVDEVRVYTEGRTGSRELTSADPTTRSGSGTTPAEPAGDDAAAVARLRQTALNGPDASARAEALDELSNSQDAKLVGETFAQVLARERDSRVLQTLFEVAAQQQDRVPLEALRTFAASDRDGTPRAQAVEMLADRAGNNPATRTLLRSLAANDVSLQVREAAKTALGNLEESPPGSASPGSDTATPAPRPGER